MGVEVEVEVEVETVCVTKDINIMINITIAYHLIIVLKQMNVYKAINNVLIINVNVLIMQSKLRGFVYANKVSYMIKLQKVV